jgi:hypothetical protein
LEEEFSMRFLAIFTCLSVLSAVSLDYAGSNFPFTGGVIRRVTVDTGNDQHPTPKAPDRD